MIDRDAAVDLVAALVKSGETRISVLVDRGWGDSGEPTVISIYSGGDQQNPHAYINRRTLHQLQADGVFADTNAYKSFKAREVYDVRPEWADSVRPA